jgi:formiminoglutamase
MTDIFALTTRPDTALFFQRGENGDPRLGEIVRHAPEEYAAAKLVILGCPQDEGVRCNGGRVGAAAAPTEIRRYLYKLVAKTAWDGQFFDLGDTVIQSSLEETHAVHQQIVEKLLRDGKIVIVLGGGNDISYPDASAMAAVQAGKPFLAVNIDAHLDVRESEQRHSGTPYRQLLEEGKLLPKQFYEIGTQPFSTAQSHLDYLRDLGVRVASLPQIRQSGNVQAFIKALIYDPTADYPAAFWGFDMDSVTAADAPGVSAPNPAGFSAEEFLMLCEMAADATMEQCVIEFSEVNPTYDIDGRTSRLIAAGIWTILNQLL